MFEEIIQNLEQADAKDFAECLLENLRDPLPARRFKMFVEFKFKDTAQFNALSAGCKAAAEVFMSLFRASEED